MLVLHVQIGGYSTLAEKWATAILDFEEGNIPNGGILTALCTSSKVQCKTFMFTFFFFNSRQMVTFLLRKRS